MKHSKRILALAFAIMMVLSVTLIFPHKVKAGCGSAIIMSEEKITVKKGKKHTLQVLVRNYPMTSGVKWKSSKPSIASVSKKGVVKGKKAGTAKITATYKGVKVTCKVKVKK